MKPATAESRQAESVSSLVRSRIERGGERVWRMEDFEGLPFSAVAQSLSRLARTGAVERLSKGVYYRPRKTAFGKSRPNPAAIRKLASKRRTMFPAGLAAANLLGFSTQSSHRREVATSGLSLPRKLIGEATVHTRRPEAWKELSETEAALLDLLRRRAEHSELSAGETVQRLLSLMKEGKRFERLLQVADTEPPRVRAMLGAIGEQLGKSEQSLQSLRSSLNPLSRFDFGKLSGLAYAGRWQAKERR